MGVYQAREEKRQGECGGTSGQVEKVERKAFESMVRKTIDRARREENILTNYQNNPN